jgi:hypothetical protein
MIMSHVGSEPRLTGLARASSNLVNSETHFFRASVVHGTDQEE